MFVDLFGEAAVVPRWRSLVVLIERGPQPAETSAYHTERGVRDGGGSVLVPTRGLLLCCVLCCCTPCCLVNNLFSCNCNINFCNFQQQRRRQTRATRTRTASKKQRQERGGRVVDPVTLSQPHARSLSVTMNYNYFWGNLPPILTLPLSG